MTREIVLDASNYQEKLTAKDYARIGATKLIVKLTEGTNYVNPDIKLLINRAAAGGVTGFAFYHFGRFHNDSQAIKEANMFVKVAKEKVNVIKNTLLILDAEIQDIPTSSVIAFLKVLRKAGFKAGFYTYKYLLPNFNLEKIKPYMDFFWLAAYPLGNKVAADKYPNIGYFPSANYVDLWQYTDNLLGYNIDGSITVTDNAIKLFNPEKESTSHKTSTTTPAATWKKKNGTFVLGQKLKLHKSPHIDAPAIAELPKGSEVKFDATLQGPLRLWLRQPRSGGSYGYIVAKDKYGKTLGKIK